MSASDKRILICDCEKTMSFDVDRIAGAVGIEPPAVQTHLCRSQIDTFRHACGGGDRLIVCCTQEAPLFDDVAAEMGLTNLPTYVNIRERAGWSAEGRRAEAKMAALIAEAAVEIEPTPAMTLRSDGACLVYGDGDVVFAAVERLASRLDVTGLLRTPGDILPPPVMTVPVFRGTIRSVSGHFGAFEVRIDDFAAYAASSRQQLGFVDPVDGVVNRFDILVDLSGGDPLFPAGAARDGYLRAEPGDPVGIERALFQAADLVGEFEKPRYLKVDAALCAHSRSGIVGCRLCLDTCPSGAVTPAGDHTAVDPHACSGHGACASVCPTGALVFDLPRGDAVFARLRAITQTYLGAGGDALVLLVHDSSHGDRLIAASARFGRGLPANVVPFVVTSVTQIGLDFLLTALAFGVAQIRVLTGPDHRDHLSPLRHHGAVIEAIVAGLGYAGDRVVIDDDADPVQATERWYAETPPPALAAPARYRAVAERRTTIALALDHLHRQAPAPADTVAVPAGAPFGRVVLDQDRCTLCLACVGACPTGALGDNPHERPQLSFTESACIQCGLCRSTCPENAIALEPRVNFAPAAKAKMVLHEEDPFSCIRCGKPFGTQSTITALVERLAGHSMFAAPGRIDLIKMCEDCRVAAQFDQAQPFAAGERPRVRTTDDDLKEREEARRRLPPGDRP